MNFPEGFRGKKAFFWGLRKFQSPSSMVGGGGRGKGRGSILNRMALTDDETILVTKQLVTNENPVYRVYLLLRHHHRHGLVPEHFDSCFQTPLWQLQLRLALPSLGLEKTLIYTCYYTKCECCGSIICPCTWLVKSFVVVNFYFYIVFGYGNVC